MHSLTNKVHYVGLRADSSTAYNAYLICGEKHVLIDTVPEEFSDDLIKNIEEIIPCAKLDYIVFNHSEPNRSGALKRILQINPNITVIGTIASLKNLKEITNTSFCELLAKDGYTLDLGGISLKFLVTPNMHWPDTMMTYCENERMLFSGDAFGAYYAASVSCIGDENKELELAQKEYFDKIMSPFDTYVLSGTNKVKELRVETICTGYGPVLAGKCAEKILDKYSEWAVSDARNVPKIAILYASEYGYTRSLAECASKTAQNSGVECVLFNADNISDNELHNIINDADGIMIGTPTINRSIPKPIWNVLSSVDLIKSKEKQFAAFGSYGWSGEGAGLVVSVLKNMKMSVFREPFKVMFKPDDKSIADMSDFTIEFVKSVKNKLQGV